jgi:hypothetical protein
VTETKETTEKKVPAEKKESIEKKEPAAKKEPPEKKVKTTIVAFSGTGSALLGYMAALILCGALAFIPLPFVTVAIRKWFYRNLSVTDSGTPVSFSFDGSGAALLKYWIPSLVLFAVTGVSLFFGITEKSDGFLTFLLITISILALVPQAWLWAAKRAYTVAHTKASVGSVPVTFAFSGKGTTALWHGLKMLFSAFAAGLPLPWAVTGAVSWCLGATDIKAGADFRASFSGKGGSLFWYGVGFAIAPFFLFLIVPSLVRGLLAWAARFTNIIGLERTVEFEFTGKVGKLFGYVYLLLGLGVLALILNLVLGTAVSEPVRFALVCLIFAAVLPFVGASFLRWCAQNLDVVKK